MLFIFISTNQNGLTVAPHTSVTGLSNASMAGAARSVSAGSSDAVTRTASRRAPLLVAKAPKMSRRRSGAAGACPAHGVEEEALAGSGARAQRAQIF
jgi:hypothetical protein